MIELKRQITTWKGTKKVILNSMSSGTKLLPSPSPSLTLPLSRAPCFLSPFCTQQQGATKWSLPSLTPDPINKKRQVDGSVLGHVDPMRSGPIIVDPPHDLPPAPLGRWGVGSLAAPACCEWQWLIRSGLTTWRPCAAGPYPLQSDPWRWQWHTELIHNTWLPGSLNRHSHEHRD